MSKNKGIKKLMIHKFGKKCMMEEAGIREIPQEERKKIKGYKKIDEKLTYHHIIPKSKGGKATEENGAILKGYNHQWLEQQPKEKREQINQQLQQYKEMATAIMINGKAKGQIMRFDLSDTIDIPLIPNKEKEIEERSR